MKKNHGIEDDEILQAKEKAIKRPPSPSKITKKWADDRSNFLEYLFIDGQSIYEVCVTLNICKDSFYRALKLSPKFAAAHERGLLRSRAWWEKLGRGGAAGKIPNLKSQTWIFNMKNRFGWVDRVIQNNVTNVIISMSDEDVKTIDDIDL